MREKSISPGISKPRACLRDNAQAMGGRPIATEAAAVSPNQMWGTHDSGGYRCIWRPAGNFSGDHLAPDRTRRAGGRVGGHHQHGDRVDRLHRPLHCTASHCRDIFGSRAVRRRPIWPYTLPGHAVSTGEPGFHYPVLHQHECPILRIPTCGALNASSIRCNTRVSSTGSGLRRR